MKIETDNITFKNSGNILNLTKRRKRKHQCRKMTDDY